ncbi:MAG: type I methionyl aminopeptidase [Halanaerobiaceae bacterium]
MIKLKSSREIKLMKTANKIVAETHSYLKDKIKPGISTLEIDKLGEKFIKDQGAKPSFKGYRGYPAAICTSINEEVVHGIPSEKRILKSGDIISLDIGAVYKGFNGDAARTLAIGMVDDKINDLIEVTRESFYQGIKKAIAGNRLTDISHAIQKYVESQDYSVVRKYVGHGIGSSMHEDPQIPNFGPPDRGPRLKSGMTLAIEPMVNMGGYEVETLDDGWTVVTKDRSLSSHYENTILITEDEPLILSKI